MLKNPSNKLWQLRNKFMNLLQLTHFISCQSLLTFTHRSIRINLLKRLYVKCLGKIFAIGRLRFFCLFEILKFSSHSDECYAAIWCNRTKLLYSLNPGKILWKLLESFESSIILFLPLSLHNLWDKLWATFEVTSSTRTWTLKKLSKTSEKLSQNFADESVARTDVTSELSSWIKYYSSAFQSTCSFT